MMFYALCKLFFFLTMKPETQIDGESEYSMNVSQQRRWIDAHFFL